MSSSTPSGHVEDAAPSIAEAASNGPHKGWSTFDSKLEGARFHLLHQAVASDTFDPIEAERLATELESLAQSYGYGLADSYLAETDGLSDEEIAANPFLAHQKENLFEDEGESDPYFHEIRTSERLLFEAAATPDAKEFLSLPGSGHDRSITWGNLHERMKAGYTRGRDMRTSQSFNAPTP